MFNAHYICCVVCKDIISKCDCDDDTNHLEGKHNECCLFIDSYKERYMPQVLDDRIVVENGELKLRLPAPHSQVLSYYPSYDIDHKSNLVIEDYRNPKNCVGHTQRSWLQYWCLRAFVESGGIIGIDLGSGGVNHAGCLSTDMIGNGETPEYGGVMRGVHEKVNAADLSRYGDNSFSCVIGNHIIEHLTCRYAWHGISTEQKIRMHCSGIEVVDIIQNHWLRIIRQGGYLATIFPDNQYAQEAGSSVFEQDPGHQHAWSAHEFQAYVISRLHNVEVVEYNTFLNNFSCNTLLKKL